MVTTKPETKSVRLARRISGFLFLPREVDYRSTFGKPLKILVAILIIVLAVLAIPPVVDCLIGAYPDWWLLSSLSTHWNTWGRWIPCVSLCLEIWFALLIGGSVFGQWLASRSQKTLQAVQEKLESAAEKRVKEVGEVLVNRVANYEKILRSAKLWNLPLVLWRLYRNSITIFRLLFQNVPRANARFLIAKMTVAFPGGLYGFLAFITFWLLAFLKLLTIYHKALAPPS